ncbi:Rieske (2Fe-2S) protein [Euzebya tangerina]|uniref:Rieske (2Fe-2S) protein n=1 Tax=Euzebya tangerina TaxID=591198 RepID=UPI000E3211A4|nr:non-heme iron oxygenase ferredoxin subunit [Euzebya tangerina]
MSFESVAALDDLVVGQAKQVVAGDEPICLVRTDDRTVKAVHNVCSHAQFNLDEGWVEDNHIECSLHGSSFDLDTGQPDSLPAVKPIPTYATKIDGEQVLVDAASPTNDAAPPRH